MMEFRRGGGQSAIGEKPAHKKKKRNNNKGRSRPRATLGNRFCTYPIVKGPTIEQASNRILKKVTEKNYKKKEAPKGPRPNEKKKNVHTYMGEKTEQSSEKKGKRKQLSWGENRRDLRKRKGDLGVEKGTQSKGEKKGKNCRCLARGKGWFRRAAPKKKPA